MMSPAFRGQVAAPHQRRLRRDYEPEKKELRAGDQQPVSATPIWSGYNQLIM